ncbi:hypothetical protein DV737_g4838, partial [Chaetothyriales sp. CBS 132003]
MPAHETLFLESTTKIQKDTMNSFMDFQIWDFPGQLDYFDPTFDTTDIFSEIGALVWVIDAQDDYSDSLNRLTTTIMNLQNTFPHINVEVFVHKIDSLNDEFKADIFQDIVLKVGDELNDAGYINPNVSYHLTSIYDSSIFEAFSKVIQKLIPEEDTLQNILNILVDNSGMSKAYLFDILSKTYVASDTRPTDMNVYELCSHYIDVVVDIIDLNTWDRKDTKVLGEQKPEVESYLCLAALIKDPKAREKKGLIDYNAHIFQDALAKIFERKWDHRANEIESESGEQTEEAVEGS